MVRGDRDVNETKLRKLLNASEVDLAEPEMVMAATGAEVGFAGPIGIKCPLIADTEVTYMQNFIVGANKTGYHYTGVNQEDIKPDFVGDVRNISEGDICPVCGGRIHFAHGIEVGNTFKLGTKYSKAMGLQYLDQNNKLQDVWMGSYGIGPARAMAALVEQNADENGINWPAHIAPFQCAVVVISMKDEVQAQLGDQLHDALIKAGIDTVLDDRDERPGVKFKDMELIGIPFRITVGRKAKDGIVEIKPRVGDSIEVSVDEAVAEIQKLLDAAK
jgi:prolyl-tRNA synthetase